MTPLLVERAQICDASWNDHILKSLQCVINAQTFYLDIVCESWKALIWPSLQDPEIVMPLPVRCKLGVKLLYQPHFCQYLGLFSLRPLSGFQLEAFIRSLSHAFLYISAYNFNPENSAAIQALTFADLTFTIKHTHWLQTACAYQQITRHYSSDRRRNLRCGKAFNWHIVRSNDLIPMLRLFEENHAKHIAGGVSANAMICLTNLYNALQARQETEIYYACSEEQVHAGILLVKSKERTIYLFNAADHRGRIGNARTVILDEYFRNNNSKRLTFDFESPQIDAIARFYKSFGSTPTAFFSISKNNLGFPLRQIQNWRKHFLRTRQGLS